MIFLHVSFLAPQRTVVSASLYNNPVLSDVTIKQVYKGKVREYHAHKAILCADSSYFLKAFTGNFRESSDPVMEIHDDDPDQFELLLKYVCTYNYDGAAIDTLAGGDKEKRLLIPLGLHALADKYDISCISEPIAQDLRKSVVGIEDDLLLRLLDAHYKTVASADGPVGEILTSCVLHGTRSLIHTAEYDQMVVSHPVFGADMALALKRDTIDAYCACCSKYVVVRRDMRKHCNSVMVFCPYCKRHVQGLLGSEE